MRKGAIKFMQVQMRKQEALTPELDTLIRALPKAELHIHLEGSIRPQTLLLLAQRNGVDLGCKDEEDVRALYSYKDFSHFMQLYGILTSVLRQPEDFLLITKELGLEAAQEGTLYLEVTFSAAIHHRRKGLPFDEMMDAIAQGAAIVKQQVGVEMRFILDHVRGYPLDYCQRTAEWCVQGQDKGVVAFGLGGYEPDWPASLYTETIHWVQSHGLPFIPHAGEAVGPQSIWEALQFNPPRIGHGFRAIEDSSLVETLRVQKTVLEICPTSNICTGCVSRWQDHPLRQLWDAGVLVTINSDDPPMFNTTLSNEYRTAITKFGFTPKELARLSLNAAHASLLPLDKRIKLIEKFQEKIGQLRL
jgi:adenosine deaminase